MKKLLYILLFIPFLGCSPEEHSPSQDYEWAEGDIDEKDSLVSYFPRAIIAEDNADENSRMKSKPKTILPPPPSPPKPLDIPGLVPISEVDEMPCWKSCSAIKDLQEQKKCSDKAIVEFVGENLKFPPVFGRAFTPGMAVVRFVIEENGTFSHYRVLKDPGAGAGDNAIDVIKLFPLFEPAKVDGKPVKTEFTLPVRFKLAD